MDNLIRKQTVLNMLDDMQFERYHTHAELELMARIYHMVNSLEPVDAVEVVRCRDCKHLYEDDGCPLRYFKTHVEEDFCSYGERKTDDS